MEFWPENQGQSPLYSKFGTVPRRHCTHNYHDRHQATHYPLYYGEQQDQVRESSYWTLPGSRTGGAPQEYTNWTDQELTGPTSSSHFPFILERHSQQHQDLGEYPPHEARDREWTAAQRAAREYERGFLREGWQRRWEPCGPVRYNRDVSTKRSDSSYRELEAWATRYSHSLPRRRRIEAELRGASQGPFESIRAPERDSRSGTDPRVSVLQQVLQSANIRESGLWDRAGRQQAPTYCPSHGPAADTSHMLDMKEKAGYQRKMFSQPPGYTAPPPYNSPRKSSPVMHQSDTSWEQEGKRQTYWSQPVSQPVTLRKQDVAVDLQDHRQGDKEDFTKPAVTQYTFPELKGLKHLRQETDALRASSPISIQETHIQRESMSSLQQQKVLQAVQNKKMNEEPSSKVIEGRKFRLNKKTGGMTIFCLVSRIAGSTETPSLPLCTLETNTENTGGVFRGLRDRQTHQLADEVDCIAPTLTEPPKTLDAINIEAQRKETPACVVSEMLEDNLSNKAETGAVSPELVSTNDADSTFAREVAQSVQPVPVKYPLWREPSFTTRAEIESSSKCLTANGEEDESDVLHDQEDSAAEVPPIDVEVRTPDITNDMETEDIQGLLVIDTTCVVVKMEVIPSPKKEHIHYVDSTPHTEDRPLDIRSTDSPGCIQSNSQLNRDVTTDQNAETNPLHINERLEPELGSDLIEKNAPEGESEISFPCMSSTSVSKRETLEERAERILGIPLQDCITQQQPEDALSLLDSCVDDQEVEPSLGGNDIDDAVEQIPEDTTEEEQSQNPLEVGQTEDDAVCLRRENDDANDQVANKGSEDLASVPLESNMSENNDTDSQLETDIKASREIEMTEDPLLKSTSEEGGTEQSQEEKQPVEDDTAQCLSLPTDLSNSSSRSPSLDCEAPLSLMPSSSDLTSLMYISESNIEGGPDPELNSVEKLAPYPETSSLPHTPPQQLASPLPPGSTDFSPSSTPHTDHPQSPSPLHLIDQSGEAMSNGTEDQDEEGETSQLINYGISDALVDLAKDTTEELVSRHQFESEQSDDAARVKESSVTDEQQSKEADEDPTDPIMEETLTTSKENATEVNILQQQHESYMIEEQLAKEVKEDPTGLSEKKTSEDNVTDSQTETEVNVLQQQFDNGQEQDASCLKESYMTEEQSQKEVDEDHAGLLEQTMSKENATHSQFQTEIEILRDTKLHTEPSNSSPSSPIDSDHKMSQSLLDVLSPSELPSPPDASPKSDTEFVSLLETDSVCPSAPNLGADAAPAAGIQETAPLPLHLEPCEESLQFLSYSSSPPVLLPSSSTPSPQKGSGSVSPDIALKEEPQYPKSLRDAVNRIRKHTAPDSENEEEEMSEPWDPESVGEDLGCTDVVEDMNSEKIEFHEAGQQEVSAEGRVEDVEPGQIQQDPCYEEPSEHAEEDTLSCSSTSSHGSGDTVIVADEDEVEEILPFTVPTENDEECQAAEGERCGSGEVKDATAAEEEGDNDGNESITNESRQSEECPVEVANMTTKDKETTETEQKENEDEVFMLSGISDEEMIERESVKITG